MLSRKYQVMILSLLFAVVVVSSGYAQDKVVVVPLNSSAPAVVAYTEADTDVNIGLLTDTIVSTVTLEAPGKGLVIVNASANTLLFGATNAYVECNLTQGTAVGGIHFNEGYVTQGSYWNPWGMTRAFPVNPGSQTFNLVCFYGGVASAHYIQDPIMNAVFYSSPSIVVPLAQATSSMANSGCNEPGVSCK